MANEKNLLDFPTTTSAESADWVHIQQGGVDKKISLADFIAELNGGNPFNITVREESGNNRILTIADKNAYIRCLNAVQTTIQVKNAQTVGWKKGDSVVFRKEGLGNVLMVADSGVTVRGAASGNSLTEVGQAGQLICVDDTPTATIFDFVTGGNARATVTGSITFLTVDAMEAGATNDGLTVDFAELAANNTLVETIYNNTTSKKGGTKYIIKTAAQVAEDVDTIDGYVNHWLMGETNYAAVMVVDDGINVLACGAIPTDEPPGAAFDSSPAFQAACSISVRKSKLVKVPTSGVGYYHFNSTVTIINDGLRIEGLAGRDRARIRTAGVTAFQSNGVAHWEISNLRLFSDKTAGTWGVDVYNAPRGVYISNVYCDGFGDQTGGGGFSLVYECWGSILNRVAAERCGYGAYLEACSACTILNPSLRQLAKPGLYWLGGVGNNIIGGVIEKTWAAEGALAGAGYSVYITCKNTKISGLYTEQSVDGLIKIKDSYGVTIDSCFIDGISGSIIDGIVSIENSTHVTMISNQIEGLYSALGTGKSNVYIDANSSKVTLISNKFEPDGAVGAGNASVIDDSTADDTVYINNSGPGLITTGIRVHNEVLTPSIVDCNDYYGAESDAIRFHTKSSGTDIERVVIEFLGNLRSATDNARSCGTASFRWSEFFAGNGTINTSDEREKTELLTIDVQEKAAALEIKGTISKFKMLDAVERKGGDARIHFGVGAQTVIGILESHGLDPMAYSFVCKDDLDDGGYRYGIRYDQLSMFILASI